MSGGNASIVWPKVIATLEVTNVSWYESPTAQSNYIELVVFAVYYFKTERLHVCSVDERSKSGLILDSYGMLMEIIPLESTTCYLKYVIQHQCDKTVCVCVSLNASFLNTTWHGVSWLGSFEG